MRPGELYESPTSFVHFVVTVIEGERCTLRALDSSPQIITVPIAYVWETFEYRGMRS